MLNYVNCFWLSIFINDVFILNYVFFVWSPGAAPAHQIGIPGGSSSLSGLLSVALVIAKPSGITSS